MVIKKDKSSTFLKTVKKKKITRNKLKSKKAKNDVRKIWNGYGFEILFGLFKIGCFGLMICTLALSLDTRSLERVKLNGASSWVFNPLLVLYCIKRFPPVSAYFQRILFV